MKVLITGGTGFIGSRLALESVGRGESVRVFGQENNEAEEQNAKLLREGGVEVLVDSVTNREVVFEAVRGVDLVYHLAAAQHEANVPDQYFWDVNVTGTKNVLDACSAARVKRLVHGSTIGVYGGTGARIIDESTEVRPDNIYGITKLEGEKLALSYNGRLAVVVVRIAETYGPGDRRLLKLFKAVRGSVFPMIGSGTNLHHVIYIKDLVEALFLAGAVERAAGEVLILAGVAQLTTMQMIEVIASVVDGHAPKLRLPFSVVALLAYVLERICKPFGVQPPLHRRRMDFFRKSYVFSVERARNILGFSPRYSFEDGIAETAEWYRQMGYL